MPSSLTTINTVARLNFVVPPELVGNFAPMISTYAMSFGTIASKRQARNAYRLDINVIYQCNQCVW